MFVINKGKEKYAVACCMKRSSKRLGVPLTFVVVVKVVARVA